MLLSFSLVAILSGFLGLSYELVYQRAFSLINGDLYLTYAIIVLSFIAGMALGNLLGFKLRQRLPLTELSGGLFAILFGIFLQQGGYLLEIPLPLMIVTLLVPAFIVGIHVPLYAYYLKHSNFTITYFLYHLGAIVGLLLLEIVVFPRLPLSWVFIALGALQMLIGIIVYIAYRQRIFVIQPLNYSWSQIGDIIKKKKRLLLAVLAMSVASYFFHFSLIKILLFFEFIIRPSYTFFIIASITTVAVGSMIAHRAKLQLATISWLFVCHCVLTTLLLPGFATLIASIDYGHISGYLLLLDAFAFSPLIWPTVFLCRGLELANKKQELIDVYAGIFLCASSLGNIGGYFLVIFTSGFILQWWWLIPIVVLAAIIIWVLATQWKYLQLTVLLLALAIFGFYYDLGYTLSEGLTVRQFLVVNNYTGTKPSYDSQRQINYYQYQSAMVKHNAVAGLFKRGDSTIYVLDGYTSHVINRYNETLVGIIPRQYFPEAIKNSFVVGLGTGQTSSGVAMVSEQTTIAEINPAVTTFLPTLATYNNDLADNPTVKIVASDGMNYLKRTDQQYQLILNTATNVFTYGAAKLHTREFLSLVAKQLTPDGVYVSWVDSYSVVTKDELDQVLKLQSEFFAYIDLHVIDNEYMLLVAYNQPRELQALSPDLLNDQDQNYLKTQNAMWQTRPIKRLVSADLVAEFDDETIVSTMDYPIIEMTGIDNYLHLTPNERAKRGDGFMINWILF